ncbi:PP2C family protein-serine/threonine phosphatase [Phocaeicola sartorii]|uniref:PP2C family protein-serine/threonine phosphatase n=1 Tax=Phocaeicola sartorii TaxID=671267 RepID=UPI001F590170|nr:SpoIIE family protein phosphatase [Phocaeicola sartorii]
MAVKILSVDDELDLEVLLTQYFRKKIRKGEYEFSFAHNGLEALQMLLEKKDFDIILSDINMPEMDGLTLLTRVNEMRNPTLKCIMVSAYGDMDNIRSAMNNGAFDFATKPIDLDDLSKTIEKAIEQIEFIKLSQHEHSQLESIKNDLQIAGEIQQAILPRMFPPFSDLKEQVDIFASMTPAKDVGGDFYDFFRIDKDRLGFVIADVSGKGVPASLFMAVSRTLIRATGLRGDLSSECLTYVNKLLCNESLDSMFVTVFYGIYDCSTGEIDYTNAGHNPPYVLRRNNAVEVLPLSTNFIMGVFDDFVYTNTQFKLEPGDALVMYTDGVTEAFNENKEQFSEARLEKSLLTVPGADSQEIIEAVIEDVKDFAGNEEQSDDITMLTIKRLK